MAIKRLPIDKKAMTSAKRQPMKLSEYLRQQAELCIAISRATFDLTVAGRLRGMAAEFQDKASELDDEMAPVLPLMAAREHASADRR